MILFENLYESGNGAQRRAQIVRDRVAEGFELAVRSAQFSCPQLDAQLEIGACLLDLLGHGIE